jgi:hypothetical protein
MTKSGRVWTRKEIRFLDRLDEPFKIQDFLNSLPYDADERNSSPRYVLKERKAHCFEGGIFASAALRHIGFKPLVLDLRAVNDDDHVIAVFRKNGHWGAIAKSNFTTIEFREPVYRTLRELAMSYFDFYFNTSRELTLREYSIPLDLSRYDPLNWMTTDEELDFIGIDLDSVRHYRLITKNMEKDLHRVAKKLVNSSLVGANKKGLYRPEKKKI